MDDNIVFHHIHRRLRGYVRPRVMTPKHSSSESDRNVPPQADCLFILLLLLVFRFFWTFNVEHSNHQVTKALIGFSPIPLIEPIFSKPGHRQNRIFKNHWQPHTPRATHQSLRAHGKHPFEHNVLFKAYSLTNAHLTCSSANMIITLHRIIQPSHSRFHCQISHLGLSTTNGLSDNPDPST